MELYPKRRGIPLPLLVLLVSDSDHELQQEKALPVGRDTISDEMKEAGGESSGDEEARRRRTPIAGGRRRNSAKGGEGVSIGWRVTEADDDGDAPAEEQAKKGKPKEAAVAVPEGVVCLRKPVTMAAAQRILEMIPRPSSAD